MRSIAKAILALWRPVFLILSLVLAGSGGAEAAPLPTVKPAISCADLATIDFTGLEEAPARIDAAKEVGAESRKPGYCQVTGYIAADVRFEVSSTKDITRSIRASIPSSSRPAPGSPAWPSPRTLARC
jgi:hypothetical protein